MHKLAHGIYDTCLAHSTGLVLGMIRKVMLEISHQILYHTSQEINPEPEVKVPEVKPEVKEPEEVKSSGGRQEADKSSGGQGSGGSVFYDAESHTAEEEIIGSTSARHY